MAAQLRSISATVRSRLPAAARSVLLLDPSPSATPPLDLLRLSTCLRAGGFDVRLHRGALKDDVVAASGPPPDVAIATGVFSWDLPSVRREVRLFALLIPIVVGVEFLVMNRRGRNTKEATT